MLEQFYHSCLGKLALAAAAVGVLALIAMLTIPSDEKISKETMDNVRECILQNDTIQSDQIDNTLSNVMRMFTSVPEEAFDRDLAKAIEKYNTLKSITTRCTPQPTSTTTSDPRDHEWP